MYHLAEQKCTAGYVYSRDRPGCQWHAFAAPGAYQVEGKALLTTNLRAYTFVCIYKLCTQPGTFDAGSHSHMKHQTRICFITIQTILPQAVVDHVFVRGGHVQHPVMLERTELSPSPGERLAGTQDHVHCGIGLAGAVAHDRPLEKVHRAHFRLGPPCIRKQDSLGVGPFDQVVVAHDVLLAGHGLVVSQKVDAVHVAIIEVPAAVVEGLGDAVAEGPGRRHFKSGLAPQRGQADRIVAAGIVPVDIEDLYGIAQLIVVT